MDPINITAKAYCKLMMHAAKYPHCAVNGVLLAKNNNGKEVEIVDSVPLFHICLNLTPMAEIALVQVDQAASAEGLYIAGYYTANENLDENQIEKVQHRVSDKIADNCNNALLILIDNENIGSSDEMAIKVAQYIDGKYRKIDINRVNIDPEDTIRACNVLLHNDICKSLVDFDNHLDDISLDWMNKHLNKEIELTLHNC